MPQKYLNQANVHALFEQVRGKAVPERVRPELVIEAALVSRLVEGGPRGGVGQVRDDAATGEEPLSAAVKLPDRAKHIEDRFGQRKRPLLVSLADHAEDHLLRVDRRDGQGDRLADPQTVGVDESEASAIDGFLELGDQAAAIGIAASVRETLLKRLADFFLVNKRQDFSHREADGKSLLDEVLRRERGERPGASWKDEGVGVGWWEWWGNLRRRFI